MISFSFGTEKVEGSLSSNVLKCTCLIRLLNSSVWSHQPLLVGSPSWTLPTTTGNMCPLRTWTCNKIPCLFSLLPWTTAWLIQCALWVCWLSGTQHYIGRKRCWSGWQRNWTGSSCQCKLLVLWFVACLTIWFPWLFVLYFSFSIRWRMSCQFCWSSSSRWVPL